MTAGKEKGHAPAAACGSGSDATSCVHTGPDLSRLPRSNTLEWVTEKGQPPHLVDSTPTCCTPHLLCFLLCFHGFLNHSVPHPGTRPCCSFHLECSSLRVCAAITFSKGPALRFLYQPPHHLAHCVIYCARTCLSVSPARMEVQLGVLHSLFSFISCPSAQHTVGTQQ